MAYRVEWPNAEYHEILPNLFQGGHVWQSNGSHREARHSSVGDDPSWDYVVSAYFDRSSRNPIPQCDMRHVFFDDTEDGLEPEVWLKIKSAVEEVVARWRLGQKVLVRCQAGYNRSGMMMSLILMRLGFSAEKAICQVRRRRGKDVLTNHVFEQYVREREGEYLDEEAFPQTEALMNDLVPTTMDS